MPALPREFWRSHPPRICVPLTAADERALLAEAEAAAAANADVVEWRADHLFAAQGGISGGALTALLQALCAKLGETPLLFTLRTKAEGGEADIPPQAYVRLCKHAAASGFPALLDVEHTIGEGACRDLCAFARSHAAGAIVSRHFFTHTPPREEMEALFLAMRNAGADLPKLAAWPQTPADVLNLLYATYAHTRVYGSAIAMSMGALGAHSRTVCGFYGSCMTFAALNAASAPGQMPLPDLRAALAVLYGDATPGALSNT